MGRGPHPRAPGGSCRAGPCAADPPVTRLEIEVGHTLDLLLKHLPELDGLVVGGEEEAGAVGSRAPADFVDLLFDFQTLEVVELQERNGRVEKKRKRTKGLRSAASRRGSEVV